MAALPRAGFWIRTGALFIDGIVVAVCFGPWAGPAVLPILALYGALLWKYRGTTIGGIVCGLQVVRLDDRPLDWPTVAVRALACFLSLVVVGLGFVWVAFDDEKQSWHDKIAGTTVVRPTKRPSLV
ncbi:MAG: RDD family protein [Opitutus sp.]|nr:RDD family protein [Opitutus sp.]